MCVSSMNTSRNVLQFNGWVWGNRIFEMTLLTETERLLTVMMTRGPVSWDGGLCKVTYELSIACKPQVIP